MGVIKMKFKVISRDLRSESYFEVFDLEAENEEKAWEIINEEILSSYSQVWLLSVEAFERFKKVIAKGSK